ncbi:MAG: hypothetical protein H6558_02985 [Lewinellaceae bacterium]|nr:hypothetical protein [Lewinellaceae bacterium]
MDGAGSVHHRPDGEEVPSQILSDGRLAFIAREVPPFGAISYKLKKGAPKTIRKAVEVKGAQLSNEAITVVVDEDSGTISSISYRGKELVDKENPYGFNEYWYTGLNAANPQRTAIPGSGSKRTAPAGLPAGRIRRAGSTRYAAGNRAGSR